MFFVSNINSLIIFSVIDLSLHAKITVAYNLANSFAASIPIPDDAPVITTT